MSEITRLSAKGQVVIPKDVRDRLGLVEGQLLDVVTRGDEIVLRRPAAHPRLTVEQATRNLRAIYRHEGPPVPLESLSWSPNIDDPELDR